MKKQLTPTIKHLLLAIVIIAAILFLGKIIITGSKNENQTVNPIAKQTEIPADETIKAIYDNYQEAEYQKFNSYAKDNDLYDTPIWIKGTFDDVKTLEIEEGNIYVATLDTEEGPWLCIIDYEILLKHVNILMPNGTTLATYKNLAGKKLTIGGLYQGYSDSYKMPALNCTILYTDNTGVCITTAAGLVFENSPEYNAAITPDISDVPTYTPIPTSKDDFAQRLRSLIQSYINGNYDHTTITRIELNEDLGTDAPNDYVALVYLSWSQQNSVSTTKEMLEMYSSDMAANLYKDMPAIQELVVFWEVPYHNGTAKISFERQSDGMYFTDRIFNFKN